MGIDKGGIGKMYHILKKIVIIFISFLTMISPSLTYKLDLPQKSSETQIDLSKFHLTFCDDFEGEEIDRTKWCTEWWITQRKGGYWHEDMVKVRDGNLVITTDYFDTAKENDYVEKFDLTPYGPGYYSGMLTTRDKFEQKYGYFECRCILPAGYGLWSAFWMMNEGVYNEDGMGDDGTEIDVFESECYKDHKFGIDSVCTNLHLDGYGEMHQKYHVGKFLLENNPYEEYNTYGVEWNENEYIFYINGKETARTSFGGVSDNPEYLLLSVEVAGENGVADSDRHGTGKITKTPDENWPVEFVVDYVKCWQYNA